MTVTRQEATESTFRPFLVKSGPLARNGRFPLPADRNRDGALTEGKSSISAQIVN